MLIFITFFLKEKKNPLRLELVLFSPDPEWPYLHCALQVNQGLISKNSSTNIYSAGCTICQEKYNQKQIICHHIFKISESNTSNIPIVFSVFTEWIGSMMPRVMLKSRQHCRSHSALLNFITTYPTMTNAVEKLMNPVNKTCGTNSLHSISFNI